MGGTRKNDLLITEYRIPMGEGKVKVGGFQSAVIARNGIF